MTHPPVTIIDWRLAEIRAHMAALPEDSEHRITWADVRLLEDEASGFVPPYNHRAKLLLALAAKLASLLPPREAK